MRFGILGPTQVRGDDRRELRLGGPRVRALLARLLVDPGRIVGAELDRDLDTGRLGVRRAPLISPFR